LADLGGFDLQLCSCKRRRAARCPSPRKHERPTGRATRNGNHGSR